MKIKLALMHRDGKIEFHEVKATMPFELFGYTFAAHPAIKPDGTFKDPKKCGWVVSEVNSGAAAAYGDTRHGVIEYAKKRIAEVGADRVRETIDYQIGLQKKTRGMG